MLFISSDAVVPDEIKSLPTVITFLSIFCSIVDFSATTVTPSNCVASVSKKMVFKFTLLFTAKSTLVVYFLYPIN